MVNIVYLIVGGVTGIFGGVLGLGGGVIIIPVLVYVFKMSQHQAQGTTLAALVPPIGLLAAIKYYQAGHVNVKIAALIAAGFFVGGYFGAEIAQRISEPMLKRYFGIFLAAAGMYMYFGK